MGIAQPPTRNHSLFQADSFEAARLAKARMSREYLDPTNPGFQRFIVNVSPSLDVNLVGVGVGERRWQGRSTGEICVKVYVRKKFPARQIPSTFLLERTYDGVLIDVEEAGLIRLSERYNDENDARDPLPNPMEHYDLVQPGVSISGCGCDGAGLTGTLGAIVVDENGHRYALTNYHILSSSCHHDDVFHPGNADRMHGATRSRLGRYAGGVEPVPQRDNDVDAALSTIEYPTTSSIMYIGDSKEVYPAQIGMAVHKFGRTTRYSTGLVTDPELAVKVYSRRLDCNLKYENQIKIEPTFGHSSFSADGDSGAVVLEAKTNRAVGLLFAGGPEFSVANHLFRVIDELGMSAIASDIT